MRFNGRYIAALVIIVLVGSFFLFGTLFNNRDSGQAAQDGQAPGRQRLGQQAIGIGVQARGGLVAIAVGGTGAGQEKGSLRARGPREGAGQRPGRAVDI